MELTNEQKERQRLQMHELPIECDYSDGEEYCGEMLHFEKKFYIVEFYHEFLPEAKEKVSGIFTEASVRHISKKD